MHFLTPIALAFAATMPVVILFYLLKRKRVVKLVSSTLLWQRFLAETQVSAPFQKLRHNWLLILQLLLILLTVFALMRPYFAGKTVGGRLLVVILDASASMQSRDESPSRFEQARRETLRLVDSMHDNDQMVILLAAGHTEVKQSPTSNKAALRRALQSCAVTDTPTRLTEALKLAHPLVRERADAEAHLFSDGAAPDLSELEYQGLNVVYHRVGTRARNAGIVALDVRSHPDDPAQRAVFVTVNNASEEPVRTELELVFEGALLATRPLDLPPRGNSSQVFTVAQAEDGVFSARLTGADDLLADNQAAIASLLPQPARVLLVTRGNSYLEKALRSVPQVNLSQALDLTDEGGEFDFVVLDDVIPSVWPQGNLLSFRSAPGKALELLGKVTAPVIVDWKNTHPLLRFVSFDNVDIIEATAAKTPSWASPIVESSATPLILAGELSRRRVIWVGFDVLQSSWPFRLSFPIFVANAVEWLNPATVNAAQRSVRTGAPIRLTLPANTTAARVTLPDQTARELTVDPLAREFVFGDTARQGLYEVLTGTNRVVVCVNLLDQAETDTAPRTELKFGKYARAQVARGTLANLELWRWIALAGLAVLLFEWWYYHRRTA